jgi:hypothetical protein
MNLLSETEQKLKELDLTLDDIQFVMCTESEYGNDFIFMNKDTFVKNAGSVNYDNGYGSQEIKNNLTIYTKTHIIYRFEYDGAECWKYVPTIIGLDEFLQDEKNWKEFKFESKDYYKYEEQIPF